MELDLHPYPSFNSTHTMREFKEFWRTYSKYFVDIWQYLVIIVIFIIAAIFFL